MIGSYTAGPATVKLHKKRI